MCMWPRKWEYKIVLMDNRGLYDTDEAATEPGDIWGLGDEGWQLVQMGMWETVDEFGVPMATAIFMRPVVEAYGE